MNENEIRRLFRFIRNNCRIRDIPIIIACIKTGGRTFFGDILEEHHSICREYGLLPSSQHRVSRIISLLNTEGFIDVILISRGRHGRTREVRPTMHVYVMEETKEVLSNICGSLRFEGDYD